MPATYDDAKLTVQLLRWGTEMGLDQAMHGLLSDSFDPESASAGDPDVRTVLTFAEAVGTFVKQGVLDRGLIDDLLWIDGMWARVGPAALRLRDKIGEPRLFENFEALARRT